VFMIGTQPIPVAALSKAWVCGRWLVGCAVTNSSSLLNVVYCTGRDLCDRQIPRPEESYRVCMFY
jgi:hypothetical protein